MAELRIGLYVSSVEGHHVQRYGTETLIGAVIDPEHPGLIKWDTARVVAIPEVEYITYKREYDRLIQDGALVARTAEDFAAHSAQRDKAIEEAVAKAKPEAPPEPEPEPTPPAHSPSEEV